MRKYIVTATFETEAETPEQAAEEIREDWGLRRLTLRVEPTDGIPITGPRSQGGSVLILPDGNRI